MKRPFLIVAVLIHRTLIVVLPFKYDAPKQIGDTVSYAEHARDSSQRALLRAAAELRARARKIRVALRQLPCELAGELRDIGHARQIDLLRAIARLVIAARIGRPKEYVRNAEIAERQVIRAIRATAEPHVQLLVFADE